MNSLRTVCSRAPFLFQNFSPQLTGPGSLAVTARAVSSTPALRVEDRKTSLHMQKFRKLETDRGDREILNLDLLARGVVGDPPDREDELTNFKQFPDETTKDQLCNGVAFKDLPYVTMKLHKNNTKLQARYEPAAGKQIYLLSVITSAPSHHPPQSYSTNQTTESHNLDKLQACGREIYMA